MYWAAEPRIKIHEFVHVWEKFIVQPIATSLTQFLIITLDNRLQLVERVSVGQPFVISSLISYGN